MKLEHFKSAVLDPLASKSQARIKGKDEHYWNYFCCSSEEITVRYGQKASVSLFTLQGILGLMVKCIG